jgi:hypothetical protein
LKSSQTLGSLLSVLFCVSAYGVETNSEAVKYDLSRNSVDFPGLFRADPKEPKSGLNAEILARQEGISNFEAILKKECSGGERSHRLIANWQGTVRSQGSEIFADGSLKIYLSSNFSNLFRKPKEDNHETLSTAEGQPILFSLGTLPSAAVQCGFVKLDFQGKVFELMPAFKSQKDNYYKISLLIGSQNTLKIPSSEAIAVLEKSNAFDVATQKLKMDSPPTLVSGPAR